MYKLSIRQMARFVDKGGTVEVDAQPPQEPEKPVPPPEGAETTTEAKDQYSRLEKEFNRLNSEFEKVSKILESGMSLRHLRTDRHRPPTNRGRNWETSLNLKELRRKEADHKSLRILSQLHTINTGQICS